MRAVLLCLCLLCFAAPAFAQVNVMAPTKAPEKNVRTTVVAPANPTAFTPQAALNQHLENRVGQVKNKLHDSGVAQRGTRLNTHVKKRRDLWGNQLKTDKEIADEFFLRQSQRPVVR